MLGLGEGEGRVWIDRSHRDIWGRDSRWFPVEWAWEEGQGGRSGEVRALPEGAVGLPS